MKAGSPTANAYERDPYRTRLEVTVVRQAVEDGRPWVVLDDTLLYPEGGGQPTDHGRLGDTAIIDVQRVDGEIRHYLDGPLDDSPTLLRLDWQRRFDHMQQHTAQHLLTALAADGFGWQTTSFHLGATVSDIELDVPTISAGELRRLEETVAAKIRQGLAVTARRVADDEYRSLPVRTRGLPEGHQGDIRLVEIAGVDFNACGGTHVANTAEIEAVALLGTDSMRGGTRLHWIAGGRVRLRLHQREEQAAAIRQAFETSDEEVLQVAEGKLERLKEAERQIKGLRAELAHEAARRLQGTTSPVIDGHFDGADAGFLQLVARELVGADEQRLALLTADGDSGTFFCICVRSGAGWDLRQAGAAVAEALHGRGGGSAELIQGKAGSLEQRDDALAILGEQSPVAR